jgi:hypothetical protein
VQPKLYPFITKSMGSGSEVSPRILEYNQSDMKFDKNPESPIAFTFVFSNFPIAHAFALDVIADGFE